MCHFAKSLRIFQLPPLPFILPNKFPQKNLGQNEGVRWTINEFQDFWQYITRPRDILLAQLNHKRRLLGCLSDKTFPRSFYRVEHIGADSQQISSFQRLMDFAQKSNL